jgi:biotin carboxyl carrier protein
MSKSFKVLANKNTEFKITETEASNLDAIQTSSNNYHILHNNKSYRAQITEANFNKKYYQVTVNNNTYNINILNALDILINEMGFEVGKVKQINSIKAPMPGLILEINVKPGQEVNENDPLFILEAMKMENSITSPRQGIIKSISVSKGDAVDKNQLLIEFE